MPDRVRPALTPDQWAAVRSEGPEKEMWGELARKESVAAIALANDSLPDDDARKITRRTIEVLRHAANFAALPREKMATHAEWHRIIDGLAAYLPPEEG